MRPAPQRDVVVAAERVDQQVLGGADVHVDVAGDAREQHASHHRAGDRVHVVGGGHVAVEALRVVAVAAFDDVAAVAVEPDDGVVAEAAVVRLEVAGRRRAAGAAGQRVVAVAAVEDVDAATAEQGVVVVAAVQRLGVGAAGDGVVAVTAVEQEVRRASRDRDRAVDLVDEDGVDAGAGVDVDHRDAGDREGVHQEGAVEHLQVRGVARFEPQRDGRRPRRHRSLQGW